MGQHYHEGQRRRLADRLDSTTTDRIGDAHRRFIEAREVFFLATADAEGRPQCSYKRRPRVRPGAGRGGVRQLPPLRPPLRTGGAVAFVPTAEAPPPVPDWKRDPWFDGTLPQGDPALDPDCPVRPAIPEF